MVILFLLVLWSMIAIVSISISVRVRNLHIRQQSLSTTLLARQDKVQHQPPELVRVASPGG